MPGTCHANKNADSVLIGVALSRTYNRELLLFGIGTGEEILDQFTAGVETKVVQHEG